jgi:hypothetical protein
MSLDFNLSKIKNHKELCFSANGEIKSLTQALIFSTMAVDIGVISDKTLDKFVTRLRAWELLHGNMLHGRGPITADEVRAHLGLSTNVFPQSGDAKFQAKLGREFLDRARRDLRCEVKATEELANAAG